MLPNNFLQNVTSTTREVYNRLVSSLALCEVDHLPAYNAISTSMDRARQESLPPVPASIEEIDINGLWARCLEGERFLLKLDRDMGIAIFATWNNIRALDECKTWYPDGTFKTCPRPFSQSLVIQGMFRDRIIPLIVVLMRGKRLPQYRRVFDILKRKYRRKTGVDLQGP